jgi:hypothetical protein
MVDHVLGRPPGSLLEDKSLISMGELTGFSALVAFPIQQYSEIPVEVHLARNELKR